MCNLIRLCMCALKPILLHKRKKGFLKMNDFSRFSMIFHDFGDCFDVSNELYLRRNRLKGPLSTSI